MTEPAVPSLYRVAYSERVREALRAMLARARTAGRGREVLAAVEEIDRRLSVYPQFGEPLLDLAHEPGQIWVGTIPPLVVRYAVFESSRLVVVAVPILPLPGFNLP